MMETIEEEPIKSEVAVAPPKSETSIIPQITEHDVVALEKQVDLRGRMLRAFLKATSRGDWTLFGDTPYLMGKGADRVAAVAGMSIQCLKNEKITGKDFSYQYHATVCVTWAGQSVTASSMCGTEDKFLSKGGRVPPQDVDESNIMKKAEENAKGRAVQQRLGIRGLSVAELAEYGIELGTGVTFKSGSKGGNTASKETRAQENQKFGDDAENGRVAWNSLVDLWEEIEAQGAREGDFWPVVTLSEYQGKQYTRDTKEDAQKYIMKKLEGPTGLKILSIWTKRAEELINAG